MSTRRTRARRADIAARCPVLPGEVWTHVARHLSFTEWHTGPVATCRAMRAAFDYTHLSVQAPPSVGGCLRGLRCALRHCRKASILELYLHAQTAMQGYSTKLLKACQEEGPASMARLQAFSCGATDEHYYPADGTIRRCVQWLLAHMPNLIVLSMRVHLLSGLQHMQRLKHLELTIMAFHAIPGALSCQEALHALPSGIETISLGGCVENAVVDAVDVTCLPQLRLLALSIIASEVLLPPGCRLHLTTKVGCSSSHPGSALANRLNSADICTDDGPYFHKVEQSLTAADRVVLSSGSPGDLSGFASTGGLYWGAKTFASLSCLRKLSLLTRPEARNFVHLMLPASVRLESLAVRAHDIQLEFVDPGAAATALKALNLTGCLLKGSCTDLNTCGHHDDEAQAGVTYLQDVLEPHLGEGLSLGVGHAGDLAYYDP